MKKILLYILPWITVSGLHTGCQDENIAVEGGRFNIVLQDQSASAPVRSLPFDLTDELARQFTLHITREDGHPSFNGSLEAYRQDAPALKPGNYQLQASYGDNQLLAIDAPYYLSEPAMAAIQAHDVTDVELLCHVANSLASFSFSDPDITEDLLSQYEFVARCGGESVSCTAEDGRNPYFREGASVDFYLKGSTTDGKSFDYKFASIAAAQAQKNYKYTLTVGSSQNGNAIIGIEVSTSVESITINETLPQEWLPKAKLEANGFGEAHTLDYRETTDAVTAAINFRSLTPVEDMELTLDFNDPNLQTLSKTYLFSTLSETDRQALTAAGISLPELNRETGTIDFTAMTSRLWCADDGSTLSNHISVRVKSNKRWSDAEEYTINTLRPEFNIAVNENDFWSKEFAVRELNVTAGNVERIQSNLVFQYSTDGTDWKNCSDGMKQKFNTHPENKNYKVRALYRGKLASNAEDVTLETPTQMPNSDMEEWYFEKVAQTINTYNPWSSGASSFWNTNNAYTTRYNSSGLWGIGGAEPYNSFPAVSYVVGGHSGSRAAELRNTASGRGNTLPSNVLELNKVAGELFTANVEVTQGGTAAIPNGDHYTIDTNGRSFSTRPTALHFWYKYAPLYNDTWRARIVLMDENHATIIEKELTSSSSQNDWTEETLTLDYTDDADYKKCRYIYVVFSSTTQAGSNMPYESKSGYALWEDNNLVNKNKSKSFIGSVLTIDDISLIYDK